MKPLGTRVLIALEEEKETIVSGIILKNTSQVQKKGKVLAVADGTKDYKMKLKVDDKVLLHANVGFPMEYEGKKCVILKEQECIAVL